MRTFASHYDYGRPTSGQKVYIQQPNKTFYRNEKRHTSLQLPRSGIQRYVQRRNLYHSLDRGHQRDYRVDGTTYPLVKLEITSSSHPFFTGKQKLVDTAGRVDKFMSRYGNRNKK